MTGDDLTRLVGVAFKPVMTAGEAKDLKTLCGLLKDSDLRPQTRAKLVGELVDNPLFYKHDELLAASLVDGMDYSELRLFFDQLYQDGKMERFLDAGSAAQTAFRVSTLGIGYIFTYDNEAAMKIVGQKGWNATELKAEYGMKQSELDRLEQRAHDIVFDAVLEPIPVPDVVKQGVRAINSVVLTVKHDKYEEFPDDAKNLALKIGEDAASNLGVRLAYIAAEGGTPTEIAEEYKKFFEGLSPAAIAQELGEDGEAGSATLISDSIKGSVIGTLRAQEASSPWVTAEVVELLPELG